MRGFRPLVIAGEVGTARMSEAGRLAPYETELESGNLVEDRQRTPGLSVDGEALVMVPDQLFVMPRTDICDWR